MKAGSSSKAGVKNRPKDIMTKGAAADGVLHGFRTKKIIIMQWSLRDQGLDLGLPHQCPVTVEGMNGHEFAYPELFHMLKHSVRCLSFWRGSWRCQESTGDLLGERVLWVGSEWSLTKGEVLQGGVI